MVVKVVSSLIRRALNYLRFAREYFRRQNITEVSPAEVYDQLGKPDFHVYDCNLESFFRKNHIAGAHYIGFEKFGPEELPSNKNAHLVFYCMCHLCFASNMAARRAHELGYRRVSVMPKGTLGWKAAGYPLVSAAGQEAATHEEAVPL